MKIKKIILLFIALQFFYALSNAQIKLVGNITTNGVASYPTHIDSLGRGGYMSLPTIADRDAIPNLRRKYGMLVFVQADGVIYKLNAATLANADWVALALGSSGTVTNVNALTLGTTGTDITSSVANGTTSPTITLNIPTASASNRGALSAADFTTFNAKQSALTFSTGLTNTSNTITVNTSQNIATLSNLTNNGIVTTTGGTGNLSIVSTLPVANGGTGATTLTGVLKGNGTSAFTAAAAGTDYQAPITLTTSGSGVATFSGNTLNIPTVSTSTNASTISGTISVANGGTGSTSQNFVDLTNPQTVYGAKTFIDDFAGDYNNNTKISGFFVTISTQSSTYTLTASDNGKIINFTNAGSVALTLPVLKEGFNCMIIQSGDGVVTLTGSSTTVSNKNSFTKTAGKNSVVTVIYLTASTAITIGDMSN